MEWTRARWASASMDAAGRQAGRAGLGVQQQSPTLAGKCSSDLRPRAQLLKGKQGTIQQDKIHNIWMAGTAGPIFCRPKLWQPHMVQFHCYEMSSTGKSTVMLDMQLPGTGVGSETHMQVQRDLSGGERNVLKKNDAKESSSESCSVVSNSATPWIIHFM